MNTFKKTIHFIRRIDDVIYKFFDDVNNDTLYLFDLEKVESEYRKVKELYRNHPDHFDLNDFASNYAFSFYKKHGFKGFRARKSGEIV